jgi:hypothetical protein
MNNIPRNIRVMPLEQLNATIKNNLRYAESGLPINGKLLYGDDALSALDHAVFIEELGRRNSLLNEAVERF